MSKLRDQFSVNDRLREYIERMLTVIIEHNPQLLEVTTSSGVSIGSIGMPSTNHQQQSLSSSIEIETKSDIPPMLNSTESIKSDSLSTPTPVKASTDKNCRL
jgi:hypothetical protein